LLEFELKKLDMKNLKTLLILSMAITLFSCGNDDDGDTTTVVGVEGTWRATAISGSGIRTTILNGMDFMENLMVSSLNEDLVISFDRNTDIVSVTGSFELSYVVPSETFLRDSSFPNGTYSTNSSNTALTITNSDGNNEFTIATLNATQLILTRNFTETAGNISDTYTLSYTFDRM
jgi:hypothetical protein